MATFTKAVVYINNNLFSMQAKVDIKRDAGYQTVKTVNLGRAGVSPGSGMTTVSVSGAVPSEDFEFDPGPFLTNGEECTVTIIASGRTMNLVGNIMSDNFSHAVDSPADLGFEFEAGLSQWE